MKAMDLYAIVNKYDINKLKLRCERIILRCIDESNSLEVFGLGHQYNSTKMKRAAFEEIKKMIPDKPLSDEVMTEPEKVKEIVNVSRIRQKIVDEADKEYRSKLQKFT
jgi:hypothetical protein